MSLKILLPRLTTRCTILLLLGLFSAGSAFSQPTPGLVEAQTLYGSVSLIDREGDSVADRSNIVVFIDGNLPAHARSRESSPHFMSHKNKVFSPAVLPILRGEELDFYNDDDIFHNVFSLSRANTFDLGIYPAGTSKLVGFPNVGLVKLYCNIHPDMVSTVLVLNNTLFTLTDENGNFEIPNMPEGEFTVRVWHEFSDEAQQMLTVGSNKLDAITIELMETKRRVKHRNKFGMPYREKY